MADHLNRSLSAAPGAGEGDAAEVCSKSEVGLPRAAVGDRVPAGAINC